MNAFLNAYRIKSCIDVELVVFVGDGPSGLIKEFTSGTEDHPTRGLSATFYSSTADQCRRDWNYTAIERTNRRSRIQLRNVLGACYVAALNWTLLISRLHSFEESRYSTWLKLSFWSRLATKLKRPFLFFTNLFLFTGKLNFLVHVCGLYSPTL